MSSGGDVFVGNVAVGIVPSAVGFADKMREAIVPSADDIGASFGENFSAKANTTMGPLIQKWGDTQVAPARDTGEAAGSEFAEAFSAKVKEMADSIPTIELKANATEADATVNDLKLKLDELSSKTIGVDLTSAEAMTQLDAIKAEMQSLKDSDTEIAIGTNVVDWQASIDKVSELRSEAAKPANFVVDTSVAGAQESSAKIDELRSESEKPSDFVIDATVAGASEATSEIDSLREDAAKPADFVVGTEVEGVKLSEDQLNSLRDNAAKPTDFVIDTSVAGVQAADSELDGLREQADKPADMVVDTTVAGVAEAEGKLDALRSEADKPADMVVDVSVPDAAEVDGKLSGVRAEAAKPADMVVDVSAPDVAEVDSKLSAARAEADKPANMVIAVSADGVAEAEGKLDGLRAQADKPIIQKIDIVTSTTGGGAGASAAAGAAGAEEASLTAGIEKDMEEAGETSGQSFGQKFMSNVSGLIGGGSASMKETTEGMGEKLKEAGEEAGQEFGGAFSGIMSKVTELGMPAAVGAAVVAVTAVLGEKLDLAQKALEVTLKNAGSDWDEWSGKVQATGKAMTAFGYTQDQVDTSVNSVLKVTGNMNDALGAQTTIANIAAASHISLAAATKQYDMALSGAGKAVKQLGIQQVTGAVSGAAMGNAAKFLTAQVNDAGSMAKFAAEHNMSLADAQKLVTEASGQSAAAQDALSQAGLTVNSATKLATEAMGGSSAASKKLKADHLSLNEVQNLLTASASGNVGAYNKLGIEVLPKTATAANKYAQVQSVLNDKLGGQAASVADTFGGKLKIVEATAINLGESIGMHVLPMLEGLMDGFLLILPIIEKVVGAISKIVDPVVESFLTGLAVIFKVLTTGPMKIVSGIILGIAAAWLIYANATGIAIAAQIIFNAVFAISPLGWVVIATVAVIALIGAIVKFHTQIANALMPVLDALKDVAIDVFNGMLANVKAVWAALQPILSAMGKFFSDTWNGIKSTATAVWNAIVAVFNTAEAALRGPWNTLWSWVNSFFSGQITVVKTVATTILNAVEAVFNAFSGAIKSAWNTIWSWVVSFFTTEINGIKSVTSTALNAVQSAFTAFTNWIKDAWNTIWSWVVSFFTSEFNGIKTNATTIINGVQSVFTTFVNWVKSAWTTIWNWVVSFFTDTFNGIKTTTTTIVNAVEGVFTGFVSWVKSAWTTIWNWVGTFFTDTWNGVKTTLTGVVSWLESAFTSLVSWVKSAWTALWNAVSATLTAIWNTMEGTVTTAFNWLRGAFTTLVSWIKSAWSTMWSAVSSTLSAIWQTMESTITSAFNWVRSAFTTLVSWLKSAWSAVWNAVSSTLTDIWHTMENTITSAFNWVRSAFTTVISWLKSAWTTAWNAVSSTLSSIWKTMENTITSAFNWVRSAFTTLISWIRNAWSTAWNAVSSTLSSIWKTMENTITSAFDWTRTAFTSSINAVKSTWSAGWSAISSTASSVMNTVKGAFTSFFSSLKSAFSTAVTDIKNIWGGIESALKGPMNWLVGTVYNNGIRVLVNDIGGVFGKPNLLPKISGFAKGTGGAPPGWAWVGEEGPELVNMVGGETVIPTQQSMATGLWNASMPGFAKGTPGGQANPATAPPVPGTPAAAAAAINKQNAKEQSLLNTENGSIVGAPLLKTLESLVGDALSAGLHAAMNPLLNAVTSKFPQTFGTDVKLALENPIDSVISWLVAQDQTSASGSELDALAFMLKQVGKPYSQAARYGPGSWDCSGLVWGASHQAGIPMPGGPGAQNSFAIVDPELQWVGAQAGASETTDPTKIQKGDYLGFHASDQGTFGSATMIDGDYLMVGKTKILTMGHIGMATDPKNYVSAYDTASGVITKDIASDRFAIAVRLKGDISGGAGAVGPVGAGVAGFATSLLKALGDPTTASNVAFVEAWENQEGGITHNNPLNTTESEPGATTFNSVGVKNYPNLQVGLQATVTTLNNGLYGSILSALKTGTTPEDVLKNTVQNSPWGTVFADGTLSAPPGWAMVGENGYEMIKLKGGEEIMSHEKSLSALSQIPGRGYYAGTVGSAPTGGSPASATGSMKTALRGVEQKLDKVIAATQNVGNDVGSVVNKTGRKAGLSSAYNNVGRR